MTAIFMPSCNNCCFALSILMGSIIIFLLDVLRTAYITYEYLNPLCKNVVLATGIGLYTSYLSFFNVVTVHLCLYSIVMILLSRIYAVMVAKHDYCIAHCTNGNLYVGFTIINAILHILYRILYYVSVSKAGKTCITNPKKAKGGMMFPGLLLGIFIVDSVLRIYFSAVVNTLEEDVNNILDEDEDEGAAAGAGTSAA